MTYLLLAQENYENAKIAFENAKIAFEIAESRLCDALTIQAALADLARAK